MKTPIYFSYKEFLDNWETDYNNYIKIYPNCPKSVFLNELGQQYLYWSEANYYYKLDKEIIVQKKINDIFQGYCISLEDLVNLLSDELYKLKEQKYKDLSYKEIYEREIGFLGTLSYEIDTQVGVLLIDDIYYEKYFPFFIFNGHGVRLNEEKYVDFGYSLPQIITYIKSEELKPENFTIDNKQDYRYTLPLYFSFTDFSNNYQNDYLEYKKIFTDAKEKDFSTDLIRSYRVAIENVTIIENLDFGIVTTKSYLLGVNLIDSIWEKINNPVTKELDIQLARKYELSFIKILEYLEQNETKFKKVNADVDIAKNLTTSPASASVFPIEEKVKEQYLKFRKNNDLMKRSDIEFINSLIKHYDFLKKSTVNYKIEGSYKDQYYKEDLDIISFIERMNDKKINFKNLEKENAFVDGLFLIIQFKNFRTKILKQHEDLFLFDISENKLLLDNTLYEERVKVLNSLLNYLNTIKVRFNKGEEINSIIMNSSKSSITKTSESPFDENENLKLPYKIAILKELGVLNIINNFKIKENKYRLIKALLDNEDYSNIKKLISGQNPLKNYHEDFAKDYINSKTY